MVTFAPSLMCMDLGKMNEQFEVLDRHIDLYHVDIMDGHFCKNMALTPGILKAFRQHTGKEIDVHLMTTNPSDWIEMCAQAGATYISPHAETINTDAFRTMQLIDSLGCKRGVVLNPATPLNYVESYLESVRQKHFATKKVITIKSRLTDIVIKKITDNLQRQEQMCLLLEMRDYLAWIRILRLHVIKCRQNLIFVC